MTKLCARGKAAAKRKFKVYPSAYANAYASKICAGKVKDPSGKKRKDWGPKKMKKGGLTKWFSEKWVDISAPKKGGGYKECGRKSATKSKRGYPKCVPASKAAGMSKGQKKSAVARKRAVSNTGPKPTNVRTFTKKYYGGMIDL